MAAAATPARPAELLRARIQRLRENIEAASGHTVPEASRKHLTQALREVRSAQALHEAAVAKLEPAVAAPALQAAADSPSPASPSPAAPAPAEASPSSAQGSVPGTGIPGARAQGHLVPALRAYAKAVLGKTFSEQEPLVDAEFETVSATVDTADESESTDAVASAVLKLLQQLGEPELAAAELGSTSPSELFAMFGFELLDCLRWRRLELAYMFCHSRFASQPADAQPAPLDPTTSGVVEIGLRSCIELLQVHVADVDAEFQASGRGSTDAQSLLGHGIRSDTHLLALMYAGEMCFWAQAVLSPAPAPADTPQLHEPQLPPQALRCAFAECPNRSTAAAGATPAKLLTCSRCKSAKYCCRECQKAAWKTHKPLCKKLDSIGQQLQTRLPPRIEPHYLAQLASQLLSAYKRLVETESGLRGWSTSRAAELLALLSKQKQ